MFGKVLSAALLAAVFGTTSADARGLGGPAELPPAGYKGQQYVDSRGCVFLRAGFGGQVTWVPRVSRDRKQLCGYPSSGGRVEVAEAAAPAPQETAVAVVPQVRSAPSTDAGVMPKRVAAPQPAPQVVRPATASELAATSPRGTVVAAPEGGAGYRLACPADTPVAERFEIRGGGTKVMCTAGNGSLDGADFPILVAGSLAGRPIGYDAHVAVGNTGKTGEAPGGTVYVGTRTAGATVISTKSAKYPAQVPPAGYKLAWSDDRLNPNRGKQTVEGLMDMDGVWTRTTPAELREDSEVKRRPVKIIVRHRDGTQSAHEGYVVSTKGGAETVVRSDGATVKKLSKSTKAVAPDVVAPKAKATAKLATGSGRFLVQVGTYGVSSNAEGAAGRLKGQGLPVSRGKLNGGALTVVYAGPFASAADAKAALSAARGMGFSDARIVQ
jgi:septal ring-binding cell division protein DamX